MRVRKRELARLVSAEGGRLLSIEPTRGGHLWLWIEGRQLKRFAVVCPRTPSCYRWRVNLRADIRRRLKEFIV